MTVLVAGAGPGGLMLAFALARRGVEPLVVEAAPRAGGKIRSVQTAGWLCEDGPAGYASTSAMERLVAALDLRPRVIEPGPAARKRAVLVERRRGQKRSEARAPEPADKPSAFLAEVPLGLAALARSRALGLAGKARALCDLVLPRGPAAFGEEETVAAFARRRLGLAAAERLFYPLISGLYAGDPELVSLPAACPGLAALERERRTVLLTLARGEPSAGPLRSFADGMEELPRALAAALGPRLRLSTRLVRLIRREGGLVAILESADGRTELAADAVVLALPADAAAAALDKLDPEAAAALGAIPYAPLALVHLGWEAGALARPPALYGYLAPPSSGARLLGAIFPSAVFPGRAPPGATLCTARVGGARRAADLLLSDADLVALARAELAPILGAVRPPAFTRVVRHVRALPQYTVGHATRVAACDAAERRHPGLFFAGNALRGLGLPDCAAQADRVADRVAALLAAPKGMSPRAPAAAR